MTTYPRTLRTICHHSSDKCCSHQLRLEHCDGEQPYRLIEQLGLHSKPPMYFSTRNEGQRELERRM